MQDAIAEAAERAAEFGAPPKLWHVGPDATWTQLSEGLPPIQALMAFA